jgi:hypothetical protein
MESDSSKSKIVINIREGILDVEGSEDFVRSIYEDFKEQIGSRPIVLESRYLNEVEQQDSDVVDSSVPRKALSGKKKRVRRAGSVDRSGKVPVNDFRPTFNSKLNLVDLPEFYERLAPSNHYEKILVFASFLRDSLGLNPCSADDIFTCYSVLKSKTKIPTAFVQALRDTRGKLHYIDYEELERISVSITGDNHFNQEMLKRGNSA